MICFPLDNTPYEAKDMGTYLATRTRGVFSSDGNLAVTPGESGLSVSVSPGLAWLKWSDYWGTSALQEQALTLNLDTADGALKRIDAIVCRLDKVNNRAEIVVKKGAPSSAPIVVPPVRDANYDELYIATVLIGAGIISISASAITDQRLNEEYCGLMRDGVTGIPTAQLQAQAQQILTELTDALNAQIVQQSAEFDAWFEDLKGKLGEDPATALQLQVDNLNAAAAGDSFRLKGTPVSIAYAGAQRIASITAYGETPQGGTTEAPVALTGISSVTVNDDVTELPIPRPLRRVGEVKDKCVTRTNSEYNKRLVFVGDDAEAWRLRSDNTHTFAITAGTPTIRKGLSNKYKNILADDFDKSDGIHLYNTLLVIVSDPACNSVAEFKNKLKSEPLIVYVQIAGYDGTNGLDVMESTYNVGFVELDGTESWQLNTASGTNYFLFNQGLPNGKFIENKATVICDRYKSASYINRTSPCVYAYDYGGTSLGFAENSYDTVDSWKSYLAAQKAAGTPVQVAYQLATHETYATDPLDFDNAAGPLTVMTGGEVEVRMTELLGTRSPELTAKMDGATYDADGDGVVDKASEAPWDGITGKPSSFTPSAHNHDDRYYTESEMDTKLGGKANSSHTHTKDQVGLSKVNNNAIGMGYDGNLWISFS